MTFAGMMILVSSLPLAAGEWIGVVVFIIFALISVISQVVQAQQEKQKPPPKRGGGGGGGAPPNQGRPAPIGERVRRQVMDALGIEEPQPRREPPVTARRPVKPIIAETAHRPVGMPSEMPSGSLQARHLTSSIEMDVDRDRHYVDEHVHQAVDHEVGRLSSREQLTDDQPAAAPSTLLAGVIGLASDPESLRRAFILAEVLRKPEERW